MSTQVLEQHIVSTPGTLGGKPRIAGRRIAVSHIAIWHEQMNMSVAEIANQFDLSYGEIYAALSYYHDHKREIDENIEEEERWYEEEKAKSDSKLAKILRERSTEILP